MIDEKQMTLATDYQGEDPSGWLMSEKFNGCRAYWDGARFWTRGGNVVHAPAWFTEGLPSMRLDGEIFAGYGNFEAARLAVQYGRFTRDMRFMVFDAPGFDGVWTDRIHRAATGGRSECVRPALCSSRAHLRARVITIKDNGGEGIMLRSPTAQGYECGRSKNLIRVLPEFL